MYFLRNKTIALILGFMSCLLLSCHPQRARDQKRLGLKSWTPTCVKRSISSVDDNPTDQSQEDKLIEEICERQELIKELNADYEDLKRQKDEVLTSIKKFSKLHEKREHEKQVREQNQKELYGRVLPDGSKWQYQFSIAPSPISTFEVVYSPLHNMRQDHMYNYLQGALQNDTYAKNRFDDAWTMNFNSTGELTNSLYATPNLMQSYQSTYSPFINQSAPQYPSSPFGL